MMGADQYERRDDLASLGDIEALCDVAVFARPGSRLNGKAKTIPMTPMAISASDIRARIGRGDDVSAMLPRARARLHPRARPVPLMDIRNKQRAVVEALEDVKGRDIVVFNVARQTAYFERVVIASGDSNRQVNALADQRAGRS